jgi:hypothetical protein
MTGKKKQIIPWGKLLKSPSSWISEECFPDGFEWKDPSKIKKKHVFRLLYHWRHRQRQGLDPLIWMPSSPLFRNAARQFRNVHNIQQPTPEQPQDSEEEVFDLPLSGDVDEEEDDPDDAKSSSDESTAHEESSDLASDNEESVDLDMSPRPVRVTQQEQISSCWRLSFLR